MCMHPDEKIRNIHERVKYLKRDRKLEAGYMTMEEYIHSEAERRAKEMAEMLAKPMAESMAKPMAETLAKPLAESMAKPMAESLAESLAASKIAQNIVALLAELGSVPESRLRSGKILWRRGLRLQHARILLKSSSLKCRDRSVSFLIGSFNR